MIENYDLQQSINRLKFALERSSNQQMVDTFGWGSSHFRLLVAIAHSKNADQTSIAKELGQTKAAVSRQIKLLIDKKMVKQMVNPKNRRQNILTITPFGQEQTMKAKQLIKKSFKNKFSHLDADTLQRAVELLNQITYKIEISDQEVK